MIDIPEQCWVFVYGTLRPGCSNDWITQASVNIVEDCSTTGIMHRYVNAGFPTVDFDGTETIIGDLLLVDTRLGYAGGRYTHFELMDDMELASGYERRLINVTLPDNSTMVAMAYHMPKPDRYPLEHIPHGDWKRYLGKID
jgi:gamma-glutamylcyclotransferase (GGCT)/AIG2-like uncharacterized protein YtfP